MRQERRHHRHAAIGASSNPATSADRGAAGDAYPIAAACQGFCAGSCACCWRGQRSFRSALIDRRGRNGWHLDSFAALLESRATSRNGESEVQSDSTQATADLKRFPLSQCLRGELTGSGRKSSPTGYEPDSPQKIGSPALPLRSRQIRLYQVVTPTYQAMLSPVNVAVRAPAPIRSAAPYLLYRAGSTPGRSLRPAPAIP